MTEDPDLEQWVTDVAAQTPVGGKLMTDVKMKALITELKDQLVDTNDLEIIKGRKEMTSPFLAEELAIGVRHARSLGALLWPAPQLAVVADAKSPSNPPVNDTSKGGADEHNQKVAGEKNASEKFTLDENQIVLYSNMKKTQGASGKNPRTVKDTTKVATDLEQKMSGEGLKSKVVEEMATFSGDVVKDGIGKMRVDWITKFVKGKGLDVLQEQVTVTAAKNSVDKFLTQIVGHHFDQEKSRLKKPPGAQKKNPATYEGVGSSDINGSGSGTNGKGGTAGDGKASDVVSSSTSGSGRGYNDKGNTTGDSKANDAVSDGSSGNGSANDAVSNGSSGNGRGNDNDTRSSSSEKEVSPVTAKLKSMIGAKNKKTTGSGRRGGGKRKTGGAVIGGWGRTRFSPQLLTFDDDQSSNTLLDAEEVTVKFGGNSFAGHIIGPAEKTGNGDEAYHVWYDRSETYEAGVAIDRIQKKTTKAGTTTRKRNRKKESTSSTDCANNDEYAKAYTRQSHRRKAGD